MKNYTDSLLESYDVKEAYSSDKVGVFDYNSKTHSSVDFWYYAKENVVDIKDFHIANDDELNRLGLLDLFNDEGFLKSKGTYGEIKKLDPKSFTTKALLKLWVLQFKDNAPTVEQDFKNKIKAENKRIDDFVEEFNKDGGKQFNKSLGELFSSWYSDGILEDFKKEAKIKNNSLLYYAYVDELAGKIESADDTLLYNENITSLKFTVTTDLNYNKKQYTHTIKPIINIIISDSDTNDKVLHISQEVAGIELHSSFCLRVFENNLADPKEKNYYKSLDGSKIGGVLFKVINSEIKSSMLGNDNWLIEKKTLVELHRKAKKLNKSLLASLNSTGEVNEDLLNELDAFTRDCYDWAYAYANRDEEWAIAFDHGKSYMASAIAIALEGLAWKSYNKLVPNWDGTGTKDDYKEVLRILVSSGTEDLEFYKL